MRAFPMAALLAAAVLAGCGKDDSGSGGGSSSGGGSASAQKSPEEAFKEFKAAGERGDADALWNSMSRKTREKFVEMFRKQIEQINKRGDEEWEEAAKDLGKPAAELKKMSAEEFARLAMGKEMTEEDEREKAKALTMDKSEIKGDVAIVHVTKKGDRKDVMALVKEDGSWKMDVDETEKAKKEIK